MNQKTINFLAYSGASALHPALSLLLLPVMARYLGPSQMGLIAYVDSTVLFVAVLSILGVPHYYFRSFHEIDRARLLGSLQTFLIGYNLVVLVVFAGLLLVFASPYSRNSLLLAAVATFMNTVLVLPLRELRMQERAVSFGLVTVVVAITQSLVGLAFIIGGFGAEGKYWGQVLVTSTVACTFGIARLRKILGPADWRIVREAVRLGVPLMFSGLAMIAISLSDRIVLKLHLPYAAVGVYSVGYTLGFSLSLISAALYSTFESRLYRHHLETEAFNREFRQAWLMAISLMTLISCVVIVGVEPLVILLLPKSFDGAEKIARIVSAATIFNAVVPLTTLLAIKKRAQRMVVVVSTLAATTNLALNLVLIPLYGSVVAALSTVAAYGLIVVFHLRLTHDIPGTRDVRVFSVAAPALCGVVAIWWEELARLGPLVVGALAITASINLYRLYSRGRVGPPQPS